MKKRLLFVILILLVIWIGVFYTFDFSEEVIRVIDGDTFVLDNNEVIRLLCIDAPEIDTDNGKIAKAYLESLILGKKVELSKLNGIDIDRYDRQLRFVFVDGNNINRMMIESGNANLFVYNKTNCSLVD